MDAFMKSGLPGEFQNTGVGDASTADPILVFRRLSGMPPGQPFAVRINRAEPLLKTRKAIAWTML